MTRRISARQALTPAGWARDVAVEITADGRIGAIAHEGFDPVLAVGTLLPGMANVHTHSFQRAMAGLAETRGPAGADDFWSWRKVMYRFLEILTPEDIEAIAAQVQLDMLAAGYTASAEFHYLHHQPDGTPYADPAETARRIVAASRASGIGLTLLPVLYTHGGLDRRPLSGGQRRFGHDADSFARLFARLQARRADLPDDFTLGVAPHSLRAVDRAGLETCLALGGAAPFHIHAAEQVREVAEVEAHLGARPVRWLLDTMPVAANWCLIHATHLDSGEIRDLAASTAVAGLCPTTEANLGDGTFPAEAYLAAEGRIGIGSDSNIRLSVAEELRALETSQRLLHRRRCVLADPASPSTGRNLYERAALGGAQAIGRDAGTIESGRLADLVALRDDLPFLDWDDPDHRLDAWIFGVEQQAVSDVWSAGRHVIARGLHAQEEGIRNAFARTLRRIRQAL